jgi:hypothetical protein
LRDGAALICSAFFHGNFTSQFFRRLDHLLVTILSQRMTRQDDLHLAIM